MMPEQEIATREKQQVQGTEQTRPGRYFAERTDGLRPPNNSEELLVAST